MAAGPGDGMVPVGYGAMRTSSADRERAVDVLKAAFAEGRLDQTEYTDRVGLAYSSRTYAELASLTADLPVGPLGTLPSAPVQYVQGTAYPPVLWAAPPAPVPKRRLHANDLALASFLFAIAGLVTGGITVPVAGVLAVMALVRAWRTGEGEGGTCVAVATVLLILLALILGA